MIPDATLTLFVFCVATLLDSLSYRAVGRSANLEGRGEQVVTQGLLKKRFFFYSRNGGGGDCSRVSDGSELHSSSQLSGSIIIGKIF